jgi:tripartite-type tricarboxylate transporter receptor subunit TctC
MPDLAKAARHAGAVLVATVALSGAAFAQADFYKGKTVELIISTGVGGGLDTNGRMVARYLSKHIPGNPTIVAKNMPGAGHVRAANYIANNAPKDGTTIGTLIPAFIMAQVLNRTDAIQFDAAKMQWLASTSASNSTVYVSKSTGVNSVEDAKKKSVVMGGTGAGSYTTLYPIVMNHVLGTQFKIVSGYNSTAEIGLAMERGEVEGRGTNPYSSYMATHPTWIPQNKLNLLVQAGVEKEPDLPNVPLILDLPVPAKDRPLLAFMARSATVGRPLATTPGVPADRVAALRRAFEAAVKDPDFIAAAAKEKLDVRPQSGDKIAEIIFGLLDTSADVRERMKAALASKDLHELAQPAEKKK